MNFLEWSQSSVDYGRKLVDSAVAGARDGENEFLKEDVLAPYMSEAARQAIAPAVVGACLGAVSGYLGGGQRSKGRGFAFGLLGAVIGFGTGMIWDSREFTASVASGAWKGIRKTRDEHWFEKNPIDYA